MGLDFGEAGDAGPVLGEVDFDYLVEPVAVVGEGGVVVETAGLKLANVNLCEFYCDFAARAGFAVQSVRKVHDCDVYAVIERCVWHQFDFFHYV